MNVAVISKEDHAKSHAAALRNAGHQVVLLGGGHPKVIPPSIDVLVCRPASSSHAGFDAAMAEKRAGRPTIIANGVTEIMAEIVQLEAARKTTPALPEQAPAPVVERVIRTAPGAAPPAASIPDAPAQAPTPGPAPGPAQEVLSIGATSWDTITRLSQLLGVYSNLLHRESSGPVVQWLASQKGAEGTRGFALWKQAMKRFSENTIREALRASKNTRAETVRSAWTVVTAYYLSKNTGVRPTTFVVGDPRLLEGVLSKLGASLQKETFEKKVPAPAAAPAAAPAQASAPVSVVKTLKKNKNPYPSGKGASEEWKTEKCVEYLLEHPQATNPVLEEMLRKILPLHGYRVPTYFNSTFCGKARLQVKALKRSPAVAVVPDPGPVLVLEHVTGPIPVPALPPDIVVAVAPAPASVPAPTLLSSEHPAAARMRELTRDNWDANLRTALGMVLNEMRLAGVQELTLKGDGSAAYERVITITHKGRMTVSHED